MDNFAKQGSHQQLAAAPQDQQKVIDQCFTVVIHRIDPLRMIDKFYYKPSIRVHIVDKFTGRIVAPRTALPEDPKYFSTKNYDLRKERSNMPIWNEHLQFVEDFEQIVTSDKILFFELVDLRPQQATTATASVKAKKEVEPIAWSFLSLVGLNRRGLVGTAKLQLFQYKIRKSGANESLAWLNWKQVSKQEFNNVLHISGELRDRVKDGNDRRDSADPKTSVPGQTSTDNHENDVSNSTSTNSTANEPVVVPWRRMAGQKCEIPNRMFFRADTAKYGCFTVSFSSSGFYIAAACLSETGYPIKIYDTQSGERFVSLEGHTDLVYDLTWSADERYLISASSDGTVRVWDVHLERINRPKLSHILHHNVFVYTVQVYPVQASDDETQKILITGSYDGAIRVWEINGDSKANITSTKPVQELTGHESGVTAIRFSNDGGKMYSGDNNGSVHVWGCKLIYHNGKKELHFQILTKFSLDATDQSPITSIQLNPTEKRLLVQNKSNVIKLFDTRLYKSSNETSLPIGAGTSSSRLKAYSRAIFSPCGNFILAPFKNTITCLRADNLQQINTYSQIYGAGMQTMVMSISFHPYDHMFCCSSIGDGLPLMVFTKDENLALFESSPLDKAQQEGAATGPADIMGNLGNEEPLMNGDRVETTLNQIQAFINKSMFVQTSSALPTSDKSRPPTSSPTRGIQGTREGKDATIDST